MDKVRLEYEIQEFQQGQRQCSKDVLIRKTANQPSLGPIYAANGVARLLLLVAAPIAERENILRLLFLTRISDQGSVVTNQIWSHHDMLRMPGQRMPVSRNASEI